MSDSRARHLVRDDDGPGSPAARRAAAFALRDAGIAVASLLVWSLEGWLRARGQGGAAAVFVSALAGLSAALCGFLIHEWGHLAGSLLAGARVSFPDALSSPFLFLFDVTHNGRREFLAMSYGGYVGSAVGLALLLALLPLHALSGQVSLTLAALGVALVFILEVPTTLRVYRGAPLPRSGPAYVGEFPEEPPGR
jgi:hypothetical protein